MKISAEPNKGASWILTVNPLSLKASISNALDAEFKKIMKTNMINKQKSANEAAKNGAGSGTLDVAEIVLEF